MYIRDKNADYEKMLAALSTIVRLSNEYNPARNAYAARLEDIAHGGMPGNGNECNVPPIDVTVRKALIQFAGLTQPKMD